MFSAVITTQGFSKLVIWILSLYSLHNSKFMYLVRDKQNSCLFFLVFSKISNWNPEIRSLRKECKYDYHFIFCF